MGVVLDNFGVYLDAFWLTIQLLVISGVASLLIGTVLAALRVGPVAVARRAVATYVTLVRNTPLLLVFIFVFIAGPRIGIDFEFVTKGVIALTVYTSTFVCEAIRSGINAVPVGQAEAARAIGLPFTGVMRHVVLPQAGRAAVPPVANVLIALAKNTSVAAAFGLAEATARMRGFTNDDASARVGIFVLFALGYVVIVELISLASTGFERRFRTAAR